MTAALPGSTCCTAQPAFNGCGGDDDLPTCTGWDTTVVATCFNAGEQARYCGGVLEVGPPIPMLTGAQCDTGTAPAAVSATTLTNISHATADLSAQVVEIGIPGFMDRGFCYGTTQNPVLGGSNNMCVRSAGSSIAFAEQISGLTENTTYYVRAYIANESFGTRYGIETNFRTRREVGKFKFKDDRDGQEYWAVVIGEQVWMAENLNYAGDDGNLLGVCYYNDTINCDIYGRLYDWATAMDLPSSCNFNSCATQMQAPHHQGICPDGWYVPSDDEWSMLTDYVGEESSTKLKSRMPGWNGTDDYGFSALSGGSGYADGTFLTYLSSGVFGSWWSTTEITGGGWSDRIAANRFMDTNHSFVRNSSDVKEHLLSLRCVEDMRP